MTRMEEEADELGADGVVGVRLDVNYYEWGSDAVEFIALGTAVKAEDGKSYRNKLGKPFTSDLSGQDFWTIMQTGYVPQGLVMGTCVYHIAHRGLGADARLGRPERGAPQLHPGSLRGTRAGHDAHAGRGPPRSGATGIVGVRLEEKSHQWGSHTIEFLSLGTAVTKTGDDVTLAPPDRHHLARQLMTTAGDLPEATGSGEGDLPEAAGRRLSAGSFSSGLTVPDFAACLQMGLRPVGLVQGFCVMQWGWYGADSPYMRGISPYARRRPAVGLRRRTTTARTASSSAEHRTWGQNLRAALGRGGLAPGVPLGLRADSSRRRRRSAPTG